MSTESPAGKPDHRHPSTSDAVDRAKAAAQRRELADGRDASPKGRRSPDREEA